MIRLRVRLRPDGCLESCLAEGHSGLGGSGSDIVCAAVTVLLRTAGRLLEEDPRLRVGGAAPRPGALRLELAAPPAEKLERVRGVTDFLLRGLRDLQADYPRRVALDVR